MSIVVVDLLLTLLLFVVAGGRDYTSPQSNLVFAAGLGTEECAFIPVLNDLCLEDANETFPSCFRTHRVKLFGEACCDIVETHAATRTCA